MISRRSLAGSIIAMPWLARRALADAYPTKPVTFVVPFAPGGISDVMGRAIAAEMEADLGKPVVVINKPSPGLVIGLSEVAKARPDGHTIGIWFNSAYTFPLTQKTTVPYDGIDGFTFIRGYGESVLGIVVKADSRFRSLQDLIDDGKKEPGKLKYGALGVNSAQHVVALSVQKASGAKWTHVPQTGTAAGIAAVLGGHLDFLSDASSWSPNVRQGQLRLLACTGDHRSKFFPDAPTFKELGFEVVRSRGAIAGPAGLPAPIRERIDGAVQKALASPRVAQAFETVATEIESVPGAAFKDYAVADRKLWQRTVDGL